MAKREKRDGMEQEKIESPGRGKRRVRRRRKGKEQVK